MNNVELLFRYLLTTDETVALSNVPLDQRIEAIEFYAYVLLDRVLSK